MFYKQRGVSDSCFFPFLYSKAEIPGPVSVWEFWDAAVVCSGRGGVTGMGDTATAQALCAPPLCHALLAQASMGEASWVCEMHRVKTTPPMLY